MYTSHHIAAQLARELQRDRLESVRGRRLAAMLGREHGAVAPVTAAESPIAAGFAAVEGPPQAGEGTTGSPVVPRRPRSRIVRPTHPAQADARTSDRRWRPSRVFDRARS